MNFFASLFRMKMSMQTSDRGSMKSVLYAHLSDCFRRPLLIVFLAAILIDLIYIRFTVNSAPINETEISATGKIREKSYNTDGSLKSITIGNVLCYVNQALDLHIGSTVTVRGTARNFSTPMNLGEFNAKTYYKARKIDFCIDADSIKILSGTDSLKDRFMELSYSLSESVNKYCSFESGTINTLLLGNKTGLSEERKLSYKMAGVSHFLVISGLHISAIGAFIYSLSKRVIKKRTPACIISILFLVMYGILVGFGISVLRALIMFSVRLFSYVFKRTYDQLSAASFAGTVTLCLYPHMLTDSSFIYSYTTVFIISFYFIFFKPDKRKTYRARFYNLLSLPATLSVFIMPVTLYFSGSYSLMSLFYNILLMPLAAPILVLSVLALIFSNSGLLIPARLSDFVLHLILRALDYIFGSSSFFKACSINGKPPLYMIFLYYILMIAFLLLRKYLPRNIIHKIPFIFTAIILCFGTFIRSSQITMLYAGQGECIVLKTGKDSAIMSDCGSSGNSGLVKYTVIPYLKAAGICNINAIFLSHPDEDHTNGVCELISLSADYGITIDKIYAPAFYTTFDSIQEIALAAKENGIPVYGISKGYKEHFYNLTIECLRPSLGSTVGNTNDDSLVFMASYDDLSILLTGDISSEIEKELINGQIEADILKIPHHGSRFSTSDSLIQKVRPYAAIISAGKNNWYGHPHADTISRLNYRGVKTFTTKTQGEIDIYKWFGKTKISTYVN